MYNSKTNGDLSNWARQVCLLLNSALTVRKGQPDSHTSVWKNFTENVVKYIELNTDNVCWVLMGSKSQYFSKFITKDKHKILTTSHPSPFSANKSSANIKSFIGSNVFNDVNDFLVSTGSTKIIW